MDEEQVSEAGPQVQFSLVWTLTDHGDLTGNLLAKNISDRTVRLSGKPTLHPLGMDGRPLETQFGITLEGRIPGYAELAPNGRAVARVVWGGWAGPQASGCVIVGWPGGRVKVAAVGPPQPASPGPAMNLSSSWFEEIDPYSDPGRGHESGE